VIERGRTRGDYTRTLYFNPSKEKENEQEKGGEGYNSGQFEKGEGRGGVSLDVANKLHTFLPLWQRRGVERGKGSARLWGLKLGLM